MAYPTVKCPHCNAEIRKCNIEKHLLRHQNNPQSFKDYPFKLTHEGLDCQFCGRTCKNRNSLCNHERLCKENPNRQLVTFGTDNFKSKPAWNKGLTKDTDIRVANHSNRMTEYFKNHSGTFKGRSHSEVSKQKIALAQLLVDHDAHNKYSHGKRGYLDNIFFMSTWELAYYIFMKDKGHNIVRCPIKFNYEYQGKQHRYTPDFLVDDTLIVEVKGWETDLDKLKYTLVDNLVIVYYEDIKKCIDYVKTTYNVNAIEDMYDIFISKDS